MATKKRTPLREKMPDLAQLSLHELIDMCGDAKAKKSKAEKLEKYLVEAIKSRMEAGGEPEDTKRFTATLSTGERTGLATDRIKEEMGDNWITAFSDTTEFTMLKIKVFKE